MTERKYDAIVHYVMAVCGGFLGVYGLVNRFNIFGSAQTANLISIIGDLFGKNVNGAAIRIGGLLIYISAIIIPTILERKTTWRLKYLAIGVEVIGVFILSILPTDMNPILGLYPIFFMTAFQWTIFKGANGYVSSTIFSTNNLKQTLSAWTEYYFIDKNKEEERKEKAAKAKFFGGTLLGFHIGVFFGYFFSLRFRIQGIWFCIPILATALVLLLLDDYRIREDKKEKIGIYREDI